MHVLTYNIYKKKVFWKLANDIKLHYQLNKKNGEINVSISCSSVKILQNV